MPLMHYRTTKTYVMHMHAHEDHLHKVNESLKLHVRQPTRAQSTASSATCTLRNRHEPLLKASPRPQAPQSFQCT